MSTTLSPAQIKEAIELASEDLIKQLESDKWQVTSLNSEHNYTVKVADSVHAYDLWCTCSAWKFKKGAKDCKHCEAVRRSENGAGYNKRTKTKKGKTITKSKIPKDMSQTEKWFKTLSYSEVDTLSTVINEDLYEKWSENEDHIKWKIHEYYIENEKPIKKKSNSRVNVQVKCWHCDESLKLVSFDKAFKCPSCNEMLWTGEGGYIEQVGGIWK